MKRACGILRRLNCRSSSVFKAPHHCSDPYGVRTPSKILRKCLSHIVCFSRLHLDHLVDAYTRFYNEHRPHQRLGNRTLSFECEAEQFAELSHPASIGRIGYQSELGGLLKHYYRQAA